MQKVVDEPEDEVAVAVDERKDCRLVAAVGGQKHYYGLYHHEQCHCHCCLPGEGPASVPRCVASSRAGYLRDPRSLGPEARSRV